MHMRSEEIRKDELREAGDTPRDLSKNVQDCAYFLREIAAQLAERNERERGQRDDKQRTPSPTEAPREDRTFAETFAQAKQEFERGETIPATEVYAQPQAGDVIAQALDTLIPTDEQSYRNIYNAAIEGYTGSLKGSVVDGGRSAWDECLGIIKMRFPAAAQVIVRALLDKCERTVTRGDIKLAARNLGLEVRG